MPAVLSLVSKLDNALDPRNSSVITSVTEWIALHGSKNHPPGFARAGSQCRFQARRVSDENARGTRRSAMNKNRFCEPASSIIGISWRPMTAGTDRRASLEKRS